MFDAQSRSAIAGIAGGLGVEPAALLAVAEVESAGRPFAMVNGRPMPLIRWEGHYFYRLTDPAARARGVAAGLAHPHPQRIGNPASQAKRYNMLARGRAIADTPAISSCSWGLGQVMGSHWRKLGYPSAQAMMAVAQSGVAGQVDLMARFILRFGLRGKLAGRQWASFAYSYNGPGYRANRYDVKMANAYIRYKTGKAPPPAKMLFSTFPDLETFEPVVEETIVIAAGAEGENVAEMQEALRTVGFVVPVSGRFGPATKVAVEEFQQREGLAVTGNLGEKTLEKLIAAQADTVAPWWTTATGGGEAKAWWEAEEGTSAWWDTTQQVAAKDDKPAYWWETEEEKAEEKGKPWWE